MRTLRWALSPAIGLLLLGGCVRISDDEYDARLDFDQDGHTDRAFGGDDCDDQDPQVHPGAEERCDAIDSDCDGSLEDGADADAWFPDADGDGFGDPTAASTLACTAPAGHVLDATDCDDSSADVNPDATEICNDGAAVDEDCDPETLAPKHTWYADADGDGFGRADASTEACEAPADSSETPGDCEDADPDVNPSEDETCNNGKDDDCDGSADGCALDAEGTLSAIATDLFGGEEFGSSLAVGDRDADGVVTVFVGSPAPSSSTGLGGRVLALAGDLSGAGLEGESSAFAVIATEAPSRFGAAVDAAPIFDDDGFAELVVGNPTWDETAAQVGAVLVFEGPIGLTALSDSAWQLRVEGNSPGDRLGAAVAVGPDVNGDDIADILVGAPGVASAHGGQGAFAILYPSGRQERRALTHMVLNDEAVYFEGFTGTRVTGTGIGSAAQLGAVVAWAGDPDGDLGQDVLVGAPGGRLSGADPVGLVVLASAQRAPEPLGYDLDDATAVIRGNGSGGRFGAALAAGRDLDGDGYDDFVIGSPGARPGGEADDGAAFIVFGHDSALQGSNIALSEMSGLRYITVVGDDRAQVGASVALSEDLTGDGLDDVVIGAPDAASGAGELWIFSDESGWAGSLDRGAATVRLSGSTSADAIGGQLLAPGDIDGDGVRAADLIVGAPGAGGSGGQGEVWLLRVPAL